MIHPLTAAQWPPVLSGTISTWAPKGGPEFWVIAWFATTAELSIDVDNRVVDFHSAWVDMDGLLEKVPVLVKSVILDTQSFDFDFVRLIIAWWAVVVVGGMLALLTEFQIGDRVTFDVLHQLVLLVRCLLQVEEPILLMVLLAVFHSKVM